MQAAHIPLSLELVAGWFEGEGGICFRGSARSVGGRLNITQKDRWMLEKLQNEFGGYIGKNGESWKWQLGTKSSKILAKLIYGFISPRRQAQLIRLWPEVF